MSFNIEKMYENTENQSLLVVYSGCALAIERSRNLLKTKFRKAEYTDIYDEEKKIINQDIVKDERTGLLLLKKGTKIYFLDFYLTPELLEILEETCKTKIGKKRNIT